MPFDSTSSNVLFFEEAATSRPSKAQLREAKKTLRTAKKTAQYGEPLKPRTPAQAEFLEVLAENDVVITTGSAGVGKTFVAARYGLDLLLKGEVERFIISRPLVNVANEQLGFLPGGIDQKIDPYVTPVYEALYTGARRTDIERMVREKKIEFKPMAYLRGLTFDNCFVQVEESQNMSAEMFKAIITRIGENSKIVFCGDLRQSDIRGRNGLEYAINLVDTYDIESAEIFEFSDSDVVRSRTCAQWVKAINDFEEGH